MLIKIQFKMVCLNIKVTFTQLKLLVEEIQEVLNEKL